MVLMQLPSDVLSHVVRDLLADRDRMVLASVAKRTHALAGKDAAHVIPDTVLDVRGREGFARSPHGYWFALGGPVEVASDLGGLASDLGGVAACDPWTFVQRWALLPRAIKTPAFRVACLDALAVQSRAWHADVVVSLRALLPRSVSVFRSALAKRAVWYAHLDALAFLLDDGRMGVDDDNGALLRLALSTLGFEHPESTVAAVVGNLLARGADATRHDFWGVRLCLHMGFYDVAALLCEHCTVHLEAADRRRLADVLRHHVQFLTNFVLV